MTAADDFRRRCEARGWDREYFDRLQELDPPPPPPAGAMELLRTLRCPIFRGGRDLERAS